MTGTGTKGAEEVHGESGGRRRRRTFDKRTIGRRRRRKGSRKRGRNSFEFIINFRCRDKSTSRATRRKLMMWLCDCSDSFPNDVSTSSSFIVV